MDLAPSDIREVATKRVLAKKADAEKPLKKLFSENQGQLNAALRLERTARRSDINESDFIHFYPYPPHYIDLCIGIMSGIRLQPGAPRHYGGSNRTIIKQAYEMLVSDRTAFAKKPIGALVSLDKVFELVEGNLSNEKRTDIHQISERFKNVTEDRGWALRVAKAICLLEFVRDLPRTEANLAAVLVDQVGQARPISEVEAAVKRLENAQFFTGCSASRPKLTNWSPSSMPLGRWSTSTISSAPNAKLGFWCLARRFRKPSRSAEPIRHDYRRSRRLIRGRSWKADAIVVSNPGGFIEGVTLDNLLVVEPLPRNPLLADAIKRRLTRAIDRANRACRDYFGRFTVFLRRIFGPLTEFAGLVNTCAAPNPPRRSR